MNSEKKNEKRENVEKIRMNKIVQKWKRLMKRNRQRMNNSEEYRTIKWRRRVKKGEN